MLYEIMDRLSKRSTLSQLNDIIRMTKRKVHYAAAFVELCLPSQQFLALLREVHVLIQGLLVHMAEFLKAFIALGQLVHQALHRFLVVPGIIYSVLEKAV